MSIRVRVRSRSDRGILQLWYRSPLTGKIVTRSADTDNPRTAERAAEAWEKELATQIKVANPSWGEFRQRFEDEFLNTKPRNTQDSYASALNNWEKHIGSVRHMESITPSLISQFAAAFGETVNSTVTVATNLRHIRSALRWAESMEMIRRAPRVVMPKINRRRLARGRAITKDDFDLMRTAIRQVRPEEEFDRWEKLFDVLWLSGLRIGEGLILSWNEPPIMVDLETGRYPRLIIFGEGQKSREDETAVITPDFTEWLEQTPKRKREGPVVDLDEFDRSSASHVISDCGRKAGIKTGDGKFATAHDIRRSFGQRWAKIVRPMTLQKMMRHSSIQTTLAYYVDMDDEDVGSELWGSETVQRLVQHSGHKPSGRKKNTLKNAAKNE